MPVFLAGISTILGAVMFLRFGYAVGHTGLLGALGIVALGHLVTIPTALALSEIATNRKVEGGGEYFIISRSFGIRIGAAIGLSLYLSQAISVAFYVIAFAEAFSDLAPRIEAWTGLDYDPRMISVPTLVLLGVLMLTKGASLGVKALYVVVSVLAASLVLFFLGSPTGEATGERVLVGGVVTHRQRPATAGGTTFLNLEDETGLINVVVSTGCWKRYRKVANGAPALLIRGRLEKEEGVINVIADKLEPLPVGTAPASRDFR